jgi:hypothetical protein
VPLPEDEFASLSDLERDRVGRIEAFMREEFGYIAIQSTRPQVLGYGLIDSPVGQLAWIMDKFREWTHPREMLPEKIIDLDRLLTNVMMYWLTGTAASAAYVGYAQEAPWGAAKVNSRVPTATLGYDAMRKPRTPSCGGPTWTTVATSPHWSTLLTSPRTFANSSAHCVDSIATQALGTAASCGTTPFVCPVRRYREKKQYRCSHHAESSSHPAGSSTSTARSTPRALGIPAFTPPGDAWRAGPPILASVPCARIRLRFASGYDVTAPRFFRSLPRPW